jgi:isopentenyl-diphosphate delta-isomerase
MHEERKRDHLRICLEENVELPYPSSGLEDYRFIHQALPGIDLAAVHPALNLLGKNLNAPLLVSSMTGGTDEAERINLNLAQAAQEVGVAMGVGSLRAALEEPSLAHTYQVRGVAPDILLFANLGAVQLNYGYGPEECRRAVEMIDADALILHLNPLQECLQTDGNTNFSGLVTRIEDVCRGLQVPVVVKEVGWGISESVAKMLYEAGVVAIDVAGRGGTSWSEVESHRASDDRMRNIARSFWDWGIPTAESIRMVRRAAPGKTIIASGGIRTGIDVAKAIALGADAAGMAAPFLQPAAAGPDAVIYKLEEIALELRTAMFCIGATNLAELSHTPLLQRVERRSGGEWHSKG